MKALILAFISLNFATLTAAQQEPPTHIVEKEQKNEIPQEEVVTTSHSIVINDVTIPYQATAGTQVLQDEKGTPKAVFFYTAYTKENTKELKKRPITFCFNGGPGSSSVWLHLGAFGPKKVDMGDQGLVAIQPYHLVDNPYSLLDLTDLVFIDPISTGYSRALQTEEAKHYHGVIEDINSLKDFIRVYVTRNQRWESPKFLAGESYGTTRACALALELHEDTFMYFDGIILVSCVLNFQTMKFASGNDLPYLLFLPSYTAAAFYHKKLPPDLMQDFNTTLAEVEKFVEGEYARALMQGNRLQPVQREEIINKLARYTGIDRNFLDRSNLRLNVYHFAKELLHNDRRIIGRFDSRKKGIDSDLCGETFAFDPSLDAVLGVFTATYNDYVREELNWKRDDEYKILTDLSPWNYGNAQNQFLDVSGKLKDLMTMNTTLDIFVGSGYGDLATPYFATDYTFSHLDLDPSLNDNIMIRNYEGGHMMYLYYPSLVNLKADLTQFYKKRLSKKQ